MRLKPIELSSGIELIRVFSESLYLEKIRHRIWVTPDKIFVQKIVSTKGVNEFVINEPSKVDKEVVISFCKTNKIPIFEVLKIEFEEEQRF